MAAAMKPPQRRRWAQAAIASSLPSHWSASQALAVFECLELLREQLWLAYGTDIQRAWRSQLVPERAPPDLDPDSPF